MQEHSHKRAADQDAQVQSNFSNIETEQIGHDEEEDTNRRKIDEYSDDAHDDNFNLFDCAHERAARFDDIADDYCGDEDGEQAVCRKSVDDVLRDERFEHVHHNGVDGDVFALFNHLFIIFVCDFELIAADWLHEFGPDETDEQAGVRDGDDGGDYVVANGPGGECQRC